MQLAPVHGIPLPDDRLGLPGANLGRSQLPLGTGRLLVRASWARTDPPRSDHGSTRGFTRCARGPGEKLHESGRCAWDSAFAPLSSGRSAVCLRPRPRGTRSGPSRPLLPVCSMSEPDHRSESPRRGPRRQSAICFLRPSLPGPSNRLKRPTLPPSWPKNHWSSSKCSLISAAWRPDPNRW